MNRPAQYATAIVIVHLLVTLVHGMAHRELQIGLSPPGNAFVGLVIVVAPLVAAGLAWSRAQRFGLGLLTFSMLGSLLFGLYCQFMVEGPDHVHSQPAGSWGTTFILTAYGLIVTEAIGTWVGIHFLRTKIARKLQGARVRKSRSSLVPRLFSFQPRTQHLEFPIQISFVTRKDCTHGYRAFQRNQVPA